MPPIIQKDPGTLKSISGAPGSVAPTAVDATGNVKVLVDNNVFPSYVGLQLTGLTASRLISTDGSRNLVSVTDMTSWVKGTANRITSTNSSGVATIDISAAYAGQASITTLGTIDTGIWQGTKIAEGYGGTNQATYTLGDILYSSAANTLSKLAGNTSATKQFLSQTGTGSASAAPVWSTVSKGDVGLGSVENTALSTWGGSTNIVTIGSLTVDLILSTAGKTLHIKEGSNACKGSAALSGGTVTVSTTAVNTGDLVIITPRGITNAGYLGVTITDGTSFTIDSSNGADGRTVDWAIIKAS